MRAWHFSENTYPYLPPADSYPSIRVSLPNRIYDPAKGAALYDRYIDEWLIAEDEGVGAGPCRRGEAVVVHHRQQGAAPFLQSAGLCAGCDEHAIGARRA